MIDRLRVRWSRWIATLSVTCLITLGIAWGGNLPIQASDVSENQLVAEDVSAIWANASFPVENFQSYTSPFGYRTSPVSGKRQFHNGLDLAAPRGSYIRSWWGGQNFRTCLIIRLVAHQSRFEFWRMAARILPFGGLCR